MAEWFPLKVNPFTLTLLHSERPKLYTILAFLSAIGLNKNDSHSLSDSGREILYFIAE